MGRWTVRDLVLASGERVRVAVAAVALGFGPLLLLVASVAVAQSGETASVNTVSALVEAVERGGVVTIAPGVYDLDQTLVLRGHVELQALEAGTVSLNLRAAPLGISIEPAAEVRLVRLELAYDADAPGDVMWVHDAALELVDVDLAFALAGPSDDPERPFGVGAGLVLTGSAEARVEGGGIGRHEGYGVELHGAAVLHAEDLLVIRNGAGLHVDADARLTLVGGEVLGHMGSALHVRGRAHAELIGTLVEDNGTAGLGEGLDVDAVRVGDEAQATFDGVTFAFNPRYALSVHGRARVHSRDSVYESNGGADPASELLISAVWVGDTGRLTMERDRLVDNPGGAIELAGRANVELGFVSIERTGTWAHTYVVDGAQLRVVGGRFAANEGAFYVGGAADARLDEVEVVGGAGEGVIADGEAQVSIRGGSIVGHASFGLYLAGAAQAWVDDTVVVGNRSGLVASDASWLRVEGAEVRDNEHSGVAFLDASSGEVRGSRVSGNPWSGVVAAGQAFVEVIGSVLDGNAGRGAWFEDDSSGIFRDNTVRGSAVGVEVAEGASPRLGDNVFEDVGEEVVMHGER